MKNALEGAGPQLALNLLVDGVLRRQIVRHHAPLYAGRTIQRAINHFAQWTVMLGRPGHQGQIWGYEGPFVVTDI